MEHIFTLRNEGTTPLTITQLSTTCHCTNVTLLEVAGRKTPPNAEPVFTVPAGLDIKVKMTVQLARQVSGRVAQGVYVYADGYDSPIAHLQLVCELAMGITVTPTELDFGPLKPGETQSRKIIITYDNRLVGSAPLPSIETQCDPMIAPKTGSLITIVPEAESAIPASTKTTLHTQTYIVTVKPEHSGNLAARLFFAEVAPSDYKGSLSYDTATDIFHTMTVAVLAQVKEK
jgi:hypothetical protein